MTVSSSEAALRAAVYRRLAGDAGLAALLGGPRVYDEPPRGAPPPYVALAGWTARDVSGAETPAVEHELSLEVWSSEGGLSQALKASSRVAALLDGAALTLDGFRLAYLAWIVTEAARLTENNLRRAALTFRAVTEPI